MPDYTNGKIYKLISYSNPQLVYYGSTTQSLSQRFTNHKSDYNRYNRNVGYYMSSFELMRFDDVKIILVERFVCETRDELLSKENEYITGNACVNRQRAILTEDERNVESKQYRESHKTESKQYWKSHKIEMTNQQKQYRGLNKIEMANQQKQYREAHKVEKKQYYEAHKVELKLCRDDIQSIRKLCESLPFSGLIDRILPTDNVFCDTCGKLLKHGSIRLHIKRFHS